MFLTADSRKATTLQGRAKHRPMLESLERRLPPGDTVLGLFLVWPELEPETWGFDQDVVSAIDLKIETTQPLSISRLRAFTSADGFVMNSIDSIPKSTDPQVQEVLPEIHTSVTNPATRCAYSCAANPIKTLAGANGHHQLLAGRLPTRSAARFIGAAPALTASIGQ